MGTVAAGLVAFFAVLVMRVAAPTFAPLYTGLDLTDSAAIVGELETLGIPYQLLGGGSAVTVPEDEVVRVRMQLAQSGLPGGGAVGYEIFDETSALGTTSFVQEINRLRALEGELARSIRTISAVSAARVHLVLPERQLFRDDQSEPTASIVLQTRGTLDAGEIQAIQHLVASAVPNLRPARVSIIDEAGHLLASGTDEDALGLVSATLEDRTIDYERRLRTQIEAIVGRVVGPDRARVEVAAELDYNRLTQTRDQFDPDGQVVRSSQIREDNSTTTTPGDGGVTVGNGLPDGQGNGAGQVQEATNTTEETTNYEISRTTTTEVVEPGAVKRLSVAVLVDGVYTTAEDGALTYSARTQEELDQISALVRTAMGYSEGRGDQVAVVNLRFAEPPSPLPLEDGGESPFALTKADIMRLAELGVLLLLGVLVLLFVVRPVMKRATMPAAVLVDGPAAAGAEPAALPAPSDAAAPEALPAPSDPAATRLLAAEAEAALQGEAIRKVGELVTRNPGEAALVIRNWLTEAA